jgi:hypothetical protein
MYRYIIMFKVKYSKQDMLNPKPSGAKSDEPLPDYRDWSVCTASILFAGQPFKFSS